MLIFHGVEGRAYGAVASDIDLSSEAGEVVEEIIDLLLEGVDVRVHLLEPTCGQPYCSCMSHPMAYSSDSLKLLQQLGAYMHSRLRFPQRWHGVCPLHLIFRRLHSLLVVRLASLDAIEDGDATYHAIDI